jgi:hypothetical protein
MVLRPSYRLSKSQFLSISSPEITAKYWLLHAAVAVFPQTGRALQVRSQISFHPANLNYCSNTPSQQPTAYV